MISLPTTTAAAREHHGRATDRPTDRPPVVTTYVECRTCGFEPPEQFSLPIGCCPKCFSHTWRRAFRPGALLAAAGRHVGRRVPRAGPDEAAADSPHRHGRGRL